VEAIKAQNVIDPPIVAESIEAQNVTDPPIVVEPIEAQNVIDSPIVVEPIEAQNVTDPPIVVEPIEAPNVIDMQPRSQALPSCGGKTLVGAGHVTHRKLIAQEGDGKVSYYMFPLPHFTLRLQGVAILYNHL
jgi:hypothetical protein